MQIHTTKVTRLIKTLFATACLAILTASGVMSVVSLASAQTQSATPKPRVSFTFDDGFKSTVTQAAPTLAEFGYSGTSYVVTDCIGMTTTPNTCQADRDTAYMSWDDVASLQNTYGWEIGSHTKTHPYLATSDPSDQPQEITKDQMIQELALSKQALNARGYAADSFATPYGDYDQETLEEIAKYYSSQRGFGDVGYNAWPYSDYYLHVQQVQSGVTVAQVQAYVDRAIANNEWLILVFHNIEVNPSNRAIDYEYSTQNLRSIASYVKSKNVEVTNVNKALVNGDSNLVANGNFQQGLGAWTTDSGATITADNANNGSISDPATSIKLLSSTANRHLFSPRVNVSSVNSYVIKSYLNVKTIASGSVAFYIDEYDGSGNWISGQYKTQEGSRFVQRLNFAYTPTSSRVRTASLQVIVQGNSGITAYLDNVQWFALTDNTPVNPNLMTNSQFDSGLSGGWTTNFPEGIVTDANGNGSTTGVQNSIKITSNVMTNRHIFSPKTTVTPGTSYEMAAWLNIKQISNGQIAFYIDEYDASGNWISGQYKTDFAAAGIREVTMSYQPSSANVASASLQVIVTPASGVEAYFDDVRLFKL